MPAATGQDEATAAPAAVAAVGTREIAAEVASRIADTLRMLLSVLGSVLSSEAGQVAAQDAASARSLPAIGKAVRRLWFHTEIFGASWDSKEEAVWLCRLLSMLEGARAGLLSFYGAGLLCLDALVVLAEICFQEIGLEADEAFADHAMAVQDALRGRHWEEFQRLPADLHCNKSNMPLLSADRLPCTMRRVFDLEGVRLSRKQAAGLGLAMLMPGSMTLAMSGVGAALLVRTAREKRSITASGEEGEGARWKALQYTCLGHAHELLRRKHIPIEVQYLGREDSPALIKVTLYSLNDPFCAFPVGSIRGLDGGTGGESTARLRHGSRCRLRPPGKSDTFRMRVYEPATLLDTVIHDGVEVKRGDRLILTFPPGGDRRLRCHAARREESLQQQQEQPTVRDSSSVDGVLTASAAAAAAVAAAAAAATRSGVAATHPASNEDSVNAIAATTSPESECQPGVNLRQSVAAAAAATAPPATATPADTAAAAAATAASVIHHSTSSMTLDSDCLDMDPAATDAAVAVLAAAAAAAAAVADESSASASPKGSGRSD